MEKKMPRSSLFRRNTSYFEQMQLKVEHLDKLAEKYKKFDESRQIASEVNQADVRKSIDELLPANGTVAREINEAVELRLEGTTLAPLTIPSLLYNAVKHFRNRTALVFRVGDQGNAELSYEGYYLEVLNAAHSFIKLGLNPNESVAFACFNAPTLFIGAVGAIFAGGVYTDLCHNKNKATFLHIMQDSKAGFVVVDNYKKTSDILDLWNELPHLKAVIEVDPSQMSVNANPNVFTWQEFIEIGRGSPEAELARRLGVQAPNKCCAVLYSSDVVHYKPHGVMLSHDNVTYMARILSEKVCPDNEWQRKAYRFVSFLPICWPLSLTFEIFLPMVMGAAVFFADPDAFRGTLVGTLRGVRPHFFLASSRTWMMLHEKVEKRVRRLSWLRRSALKFAQIVNLKSTYSRILRGEKPHIIPPKKTVKYITKKVKRKLGLDHVNLFLSFGAPLKLDTLEFFLGFNIPICFHAMNNLTSYEIGTVGTELPGCLSKLVGTVSSNNGKLLVNGRHMCMGILHKLDTHTDDDSFVYLDIIAYKTISGSMYITGTTSDTLVLSDGSFVACKPLERVFKECLPIISNCMLIGHQRPFVSVLLTLKTEVDPATLKSTTVLIKAVQSWLQSHGAFFTTVKELLRSSHNIVFEAIEDTIIHINQQIRHRNTSIKAWKLLPADFSVLEGELDPTTMDIYREMILRNYKETIDKIYTTA